MACIVGLAVAVAVVADLARLNDRYFPHGDADPAGHRMAFLRNAAHRVIPDSATVYRTRVRPYQWDPSRCDGLPPGWSAAEIDVDFSGADLTDIDRAFTQLGWRVTSNVDGDVIRDYQPPREDAHYDADAALFRVHAGWEIEITTEPAHVPAHDC